MNDFRVNLLNEQKFLTDLSKKLKRKKAAYKNLPDGRLRISTDHGFPRYYKYKDRQCKYLKKNPENMKLIRTMAQIEYEDRVYVIVQKRLSQINRILKDYSDFEIDAVFQNQHNARKELVTPVVLDWESEFQKWCDEEYEGKDFIEGLPEIFTEKGERVRSKSEKIIADYFYHEGIAYHYEKPLVLKNGVTVYPDFTLFPKRLRKEMYWEHMGMMDVEEYSGKAARKIDTYIRNDIFPGDRLIMSMETSSAGLQMDIIKMLAEKYLK